MTAKTIHDDFVDVAKGTNSALTKVQGTFDLTYDIRNLDFVRYIMKIEEEDFAIQGVCDMLAGTSEKPSFFSGITPVRNSFSIKCLYSSHKGLPEFSIYESGMIKKLWNKEYLVFESEGENFLARYRRCDEINYLEERIRDSAEVSPAITCKVTDGGKELTILFQSFIVELQLFEKMIEFCKRLHLQHAD